MTRKGTEHLTYKQAQDYVKKALTLNGNSLQGA